MTRLVDADKLVWSIPPEEHIARCIVANAPTVDAVPVVHAQWITKEDPVFADKYYCSNCGEQANVDLYGEWILSKYCPNCGARMDAERNNE